MMVTHQHTQRTAVLDVMTDNPVCAVPTDTVDRVAQLMRSEDVGPIPVINNHQNRQLLGIITDRDLALKVVAEGRDPRSTTVETVMTRNPVTVHSQADLQRVLKLMADHQVRRIPVVDDQGRLLGIIAQADVAMRVEAPQQTAALDEQISQPGRMMHGWNMPMMPYSPRARQGDGDDTTKLLGGLALGAALMYLFDPDRGNRRRKLLLDQVNSFLSQSDDALGKTGRDLRNRTRGLMAETSARLTGEEPDDVVLVERVRSAMGRVISHRSTIEVTAENGRVTLRGPILAHEVDDLLSTVAAVRGVSSTDNQLEVYKQAGDVPSLQGGTARPGQRFELMQENWAPAPRLLTSAAGVGLAVAGARRGDLVGFGLGALGLGLLARGLTNIETQRLVGAGAGRRAVDVQKTITINAPLAEVFRFWSNFANFPRFMAGLHEVRDLGNGRSHWVAAGPAGVPVTWDAVITRSEPNKLLAWKSEPGTAVANTGSIRFEPLADNRTRVSIRLSYSPPAGAIGHAIAMLFGADPESQMDADLVRLKSLFEHGKASVGSQTISREEIEQGARLQEREGGAVGADMQRRTESGQPGGGAGRVDWVGHSGIYPASGPLPEGDAEIRAPASWGQGERGAAGYEESGRSETPGMPPTDQNKS
jgi:uncharacterized membrane protein/CBS domain-containing protein